MLHVFVYHRGETGSIDEYAHGEVSGEDLTTWFRNVTALEENGLSDWANKSPPNSYSYQITEPGSYPDTWKRIIRKRLRYTPPERLEELIAIGLSVYMLEPEGQ